MTIESSLSFLLAIFIFGITPGPGVFAILARAMVSGASSCFFLALGMVASDIIYLVLACYGLAALAENWGEAFMVVRIVGALYLVFLGIKMWRASRQQLSTEVEVREKTEMSFLQGFIISASNPKVILFYIAFLPTFMDLTILTGADIVLAAFLTLIGLMVGLMMIAYGASSARRYVRSARGQKLLNRTSGSVMIGAGAYLVSSGS
ncbi:MAG: LysE family translocator [Proteobacteria bacterium]|nr:LysE family translocator [Pseudomonadota bacterium]